MRTTFGYVAWLLAVAFFIGMGLDTSDSGWLTGFVAGIGSLWNADPAFGYRDTDYVQTYVESWAESKVG